MCSTGGLRTAHSQMARIENVRAPGKLGNRITHVSNCALMQILSYTELPEDATIEAPALACFLLKSGASTDVDDGNVFNSQAQQSSSTIKLTIGRAITRNSGQLDEQEDCA